MHRQLLTNLWQGVRLAFLRQPQPVASVGQLLLLLALGWGCALLADWRQAPPGAPLAPWGLVAEAARGYLGLLMVALIVALERGRIAFLPLSVALAAADVTVWAVWLAVVTAWPLVAPDSFSLASRYLWQIAFAWQVAILLPALKATRGQIGLRGLGYAGLYAAGLYLNLHLMPDYPLFEPASTAETAALDIEAIYYRQPALLRRELAGVVPGNPGRSELFVITFAGFGEEDVFKREALQVSQLMGARFGAESRVVRLINNRATLAEHPLASRSNLDRTLRELAKKMQPAEDILFLFMTSHGSERGEFAIELGDLGLNTLHPADLRAALDAAGIRWRVVVLSACYAGQFIETLASPETLLITAAAKNKSSFGCAHENAWTYFGEAYFKQALSQTYSFTAAFARAQAIIGAREKREGKQASEPQMTMGEEIAPILARFEAQF